jgi:hypothetical protein
MTLPEGVFLSAPGGGFAAFQQTVTYPYPTVGGGPFMGFGVNNYPTAVTVADFDKNGLNDLVASSATARRTGASPSSCSRARDSGQRRAW